MNRGLNSRLGLVPMLLAAALQVKTSYHISSYTYGITADPDQGLRVAGAMFIGALAALISPRIGGILAIIVNIPGFFVSWIGTAGGDPWMANKAFSQATFVNVAVYWVGLGWYLFAQWRQRRAPG